MTLPELAAQAARCFAERYGRAPCWMVAAPGRVNLIGEHTDYNEGFALPLAIERHTVVAAAPHAERRATVFSTHVSDTVQIDLAAPITPSFPAWANYIRGVLAGFRQRGLPLPGFEAVILSSVPAGAGLASSAALAVATTTLLEAVSGHRLQPLQKALLCQEAEQNFAGLPCGLMDQLTSVMARRQDHLLRLDCRTHVAEPVPLTDADVSILIINSNVRHELTGGEYAVRRAQCEEAARRLAVPSLRHASLALLEDARDRLDPVLFRRARHVVTENARTLAAAEALRAGRWSEVGQL
ncbi:MAG TPA: galactokinase, partial [Methylomirabilota bacterium]|nr:galactokinase [Methylomirabilota bacterium]